MQDLDYELTSLFFFNDSLLWTCFVLVGTGVQQAESLQMVAHSAFILWMCVQVPLEWDIFCHKKVTVSQEHQFDKKYCCCPCTVRILHATFTNKYLVAVFQLIITTSIQIHEVERVWSGQFKWCNIWHGIEVPLLLQKVNCFSATSVCQWKIAAAAHSRLAIQELA